MILAIILVPVILYCAFLIAFPRAMLVLTLVAAMYAIGGWGEHPTPTDVTATDYPIPVGDLSKMTTGQLQTRAVQASHLIDRWYSLHAACVDDPKSLACDNANRVKAKLQSVGFALGGSHGNHAWFDAMRI